MHTAKVSQHYTMDDSDSSLRFVSPNRTQALTTLLLTLGTLFIFSILAAVIWSGSLMLWAMGLAAILFFPVICLGGFIVVVSAAYESVELLWQVIGKEVMEIRHDSITLRHQIFGLGVTRPYAAHIIDAVFVSPLTNIGFGAVYTRGVSLFSRFGLGFSAFRSFKHGRVALHSGKTAFGEDNIVHFGSSLDESEAQQIVAMIHRKFPQYKGKA